MTLGGFSADSSSSLIFDVGTSADRIFLSSAKLNVNLGGGIISINPLSGFGPGIYDLISFNPGQATGLNRLSLASSNVGGYSLSLQSTPVSEQLVVLAPEPSSLALIGIIPFCLSRRISNKHRRQVLR